MTTPDHQRLTELQALTRPATAPRPPTSQLLRSAQTQIATDQPDDEAEDSVHAEASRSPAREAEDTPLPTQPETSPPTSFPNTRPQTTHSSTPPEELTQRVQQTASTTLQLRDQREFKLTLEEDTSRDDALVERLAEQTVTIIQQRDEMLYQRVMQTIEQRLAQGRSGLS